MRSFENINPRENFRFYSNHCVSPSVRPICFPRLYVHHRPCTLQSINFNIWFSDLSVLSITILVGCEGVFGEGRLSDVLRPT